jgi:nitrogen regulatory protein PII
MKLTVILSIRESHDEVAALLDKAGVRRFSTVSIRGFKKNKHANLPNWFGENAPNVKTNSIMFFCFTTDEEALRLIATVDQHNLDTGQAFPLHAFVMDVDQHSQLL